jgi:hypothetical protein
LAINYQKRFLLSINFLAQNCGALAHDFNLIKPAARSITAGGYKDDDF